MRYQKVSIETDDLEGETLAAEISTAEGAETLKDQATLVLFLHDLPYGHSHAHNDFYGHLRKHFADKNFQTLTFDFQSCGQSEGREEDFTLETARENIDRVLKWAKRRGFTDFIFVACGAAAALAIESSDQSTQMLFLFWPAVDLASYAQNLFYEADGVTVTARGRKIGGGLLEHMKDYDRAKTAKSLKIPVFVQYGAQDPQAQSQIGYIKAELDVLRIDITSYADGNSGLPDPRHREMAFHHVGQFLQKYA